MINWRSERGTSSAMLLTTWGLMMAFLAISFDFILAYVYQQQIRTSVEAAVTAGAAQARYKMPVKLYRTRYDWRTQTVCFPNGDGTQYCQTYGWFDSSNADVVLPEDWERAIWTPWAYEGQSMPAAYPGYCSPGQSKPYYYRCSRAEVVKSQCRLVEKTPGLAIAKAREAYTANSSRWSDKLTKITMVEPMTVRASGIDFQVTMGVQAEMPTMFLRLFGIDTFPIRVRSADMGSSFGAETVRMGSDPCR